MHTDANSQKGAGGRNRIRPALLSFALAGALLHSACGLQPDHPRNVAANKVAAGAAADPLATLAAAQSQAANAGATVTQHAAATTQAARATQAAFEQQLTSQAFQITMDAATSQAALALDQATANAEYTQVAVTAHASAEASAATATATAAYALFTVEQQARELDLQQRQDRQWVSTWGPVISWIILLAALLLGGALSFVLIVRKYNLLELQTQASRSDDTILTYVKDARAGPVRVFLNWLLGTNAITMLKPGRAMSPVTEIESKPRADGHRAHAAQLAPVELQADVTARDQAAALVRAWSSSPSRSSMAPRHIHAAADPTRLIAPPAGDTEEQATDNLLFDRARDIEGEFVVVHPNEAGYQRLQPWVDDVRAQLTAQGHEE